MVSIWIYTGSYALALAGGYFIVKLVLRQYPLPSDGLPRAGAIIGILERIFVLTLVLMGQYTSIALVLTAKSITRFEDLKQRKFAEYYLIGTLSSILFSMFIGILAKWLLDVINC